MIKYLFIYITCFLVSCGSKGDNTPRITNPTNGTEVHQMLGKENAIRQVREALKGKIQLFASDTLIKTPPTAIAIAEPILFDVFGKERILEEKPYEVFLIDGYWYISGTLPKSYNKGGAFEIIFSAKDGRIISLTHYK